MRRNNNSCPLRFRDCSSRMQYRIIRNRRESLLATTNGEEQINVDSSSSSSEVSSDNHYQNLQSELDRMSVDDEQNTVSESEADNSIHENDYENMDYLENASNDTDSDNSTTMDREEEEADPLLYPNAPITVGESMLAILSFCLRHNLTGVAIEDLLKLVSLHCIQPNQCIRSMYLFRKYFERMNIVTPTKRFYCTSCLCQLNANQRCEECPRNNGISYFIELSITAQLETLYKREGFIDSLKHRENRNKIITPNYEDIYDGRVYRKLYPSPNITPNRHNISFSWNSDGVSLFKSSKFQVWPFFLSINELPFSERFKKGNLILAGLWFGHKKPLPPLFLSSISNELVELRNGIDIYVPNHIPNQIRIQVEVICGTCDLPAKALFLNMKQYNGVYGCQKCKIVTEPADERSRVRVYPYLVNLPLRTQDETNECAIQAAEFNNFDICGVKGPSALAPFVPEYIRYTVVDVMHCTYLGVVKSLLTMWFSCNFSNENWSLRQHMPVIDRKLCSISPPDFIVRLPRSISEHFQYLKASELKSWFFYYSLPILYSIMDGVYFDHYKLLVHGVYLLNQKSISSEQIDMAENLLSEFSARFADLYGIRHMTANVHNLLHLPDTVRDFGPLWVTSCFSYENANGDLRTLVTGTRFAELQICSGISLFMNLPNLKNTILTRNTPVHDFCEYLSIKKAKYRLSEISSRIYAVGVYKEMNTIPEMIIRKMREQNIIYTELKVFLRLIKNGFLYTSESYGRSTKTNSKYVKFYYNGEIYFGKINCFVKTINCVCESDICNNNCNIKYYAIINMCNVNSSFHPMAGIDFTYLYECYNTKRMLAIEVNDLISVCINVSMISDSINYLIEPVNLIEIE